MEHGGRGRERFWRAHVSAWRRSGLTQREYCKRQGLGEWSFSSWKRRLAAGGAPEVMGFVPVAVKGRVDGGGNWGRPRQHPLTVVVGERYRIEVGEGFSGKTLAEVLAVLGRQ